MIGFLQLFKENAAKMADKPALIFSRDQSVITYKELDEISGKVYHWLHDRGLGKEDQIVILLPRGILIPAVMVGIWKNGSSCIICESTMAPERIRYIISDSSAGAVITEKEMDDILSLDPLDGSRDADKHDSAFVVYTSGTTGNPKGVIHEYGNIDEILRNNRYQGELLFRPADVFAYNSPLNFIAAVEHAVNVFSAGAAMLLMDTDDVRNTDRLIRVYERHGVTCTFMTPTFYRTIGHFNDQMEWIALGGEPCSNLYNGKIRLYIGYNASEAGRVMTLFQIDRPYSITPVGTSQGGEEIFLLDEEGRPVEDGERGEIAFINSFVRGYMNLPEKTAQFWHDGLYFSGDIGYKLPDGNIVLEGRNDDMIKINGNRIEPEEIEASARQELGLSWACAKGFVTEERSFVALYYTDDVKLDPKESRELLTKKLPEYMLPSYFVKIDHIPMLPNGKLDKKALIMPDPECCRSAYAPPESELEETLLRAFQKILRRDDLGVDDDFYELGGDSFKSIALITLIDDPALNAALLYKNRTVRKLAEAMHEKSIHAGESVYQRDQAAREKDHPLLPMQYHLMDILLYNPSSSFANMPAFWRMPKGAVDEEKLLNAFRTLILNHPILQSTIQPDGEMMFVNHYDPSFMPALEIEELSENELAEVSKGLICPFKLIRAPLYRIRIFRTEKYIYVFMDVHHIFSDGISQQILCQNLSDAYHGKKLPRDNAFLFYQEAFERQHNETGRQAHEWNVKKYGHTDWCRNITPDMESRDNHAAFISAPFPVKRRELDDCCEAKGITISTLALAASLLTIHRYEKKNDIMVSWIFHGRDQAEYQFSVAPLIRELPMAVSFDRIVSAEQLFEEIKYQTTEGIIHADDPYIVDTTMISVNDAFRIRNQGRMRNLSGIEGITSEPVELPDKGRAVTLMNLQLLEGTDGEYTLCLSYAEHRYRYDTAVRVLDMISENITDLLSAGHLSDTRV